MFIRVLFTLNMTLASFSYAYKIRLNIWNHVNEDVLVKSLCLQK